MQKKYINTEVSTGFGEEENTVPSGRKVLKPRLSEVRELKEKNIPEEIRALIADIYDDTSSKVYVKKMEADPFMVAERFHLRRGGDVPMVSITRISFHDGKMIDSFSTESHMPGRYRVCHSMENMIEGASYVAVTKYSTDVSWARVQVGKQLTVYARDPEPVMEYLKELQYVESAGRRRST